MISKKVITQTIPTVYSDNEDFMIPRDTYGLSGNSSKIKSTSILNNQSAKINNYGYASSNNSSSNPNMARKMNISLNNSVANKKASENGGGASLKPVSYFDFHLKKSQESLNASKKSIDQSDTLNLNMTAKHKLNKHQSISFENDSPTAVPITPFQQNFQKYVIERHVNHFNHRQAATNATKHQVDKKLAHEDSSKGKGNVYNKSYFYNESLSDTKSLADDKIDKVDTLF